MRGAGPSAHPRTPLPPLSSTTSALAAGGSSTPSLAHSYRARRGGPLRWSLSRRGIAQGVPTTQLARELDRDRSQLFELRHRLQEAVFAIQPRMPLDDPVLEADGMD